MDAALSKALREGAADALGFVLGGVAGREVGLLFGVDFFGSPGWGTPQMIGLLLVAAGCGVGRALFRRLLLRGPAR
ncbi:MAG: hypothetical protein ABW005_03100 [Burkholderiaceae bacterium]